MMDPSLERILKAATLAPSGDNTQPWRFIVDAKAGTIAFQVDEKRDPSPMNAGQRMARIAAGAALENLVRAARAIGWEMEIEEGVSPTLTQVRLTGNGGAEGPIEDTLTDRVTNRRPFDGRPLAAETVARLASETPALNGVRTQWIVGTDRLGRWADVIGASDAAMFGHPEMRQAFLKKVRFDVPEDETANEGLSMASLELSAADRLALRFMRRSPDWILRFGGARRVFKAKARQLVVSSSGLCIIIAPDDTEQTDLLVGRAMQRAWLALAGQGFAAQPMMSLAVLENVLTHGEPSLIASLGRDRVATLLDTSRALVPELGLGRLAFLMRFGTAPPPSGRTGRLPLASSVVAIGSPPQLSHGTAVGSPG